MIVKCNSNYTEMFSVLFQGEITCNMCYGSPKYELKQYKTLS